MSLGHCRKRQVLGSFTAVSGGHLFKSSSAPLFFYDVLVGECKLSQLNEDMWTSIHISAERHSGKGRTEDSVQSIKTWRCRYCCGDQQLCFSLARERKY